MFIKYNTDLSPYNLQQLQQHMKIITNLHFIAKSKANLDQQTYKFHEKHNRSKASLK